MHRPTATDKSFAPKNCDSFYALVPVPNLKANINWNNKGNDFKNHVIKVLSEKVLFNLEDNIVEEFYMSPQIFK